MKKIIFILFFILGMSAYSHWIDYKDMPLWMQRGGGNYIISYHARYLGGAHKWDEKISAWEERLSKAKNIGYNALYWGAIRSLPKDLCLLMDKYNIAFIARIEGMMYFENDHLDMMEKIRPGGWAEWHNWPLNTNWWGKFPQSMMGVNIRRDGTPLIEYYGSKYVERTAGCIDNPYFLKQRELYIKGICSGKRVFPDEPVPECSGLMKGIWYDNPDSNIVCYSPLSKKKWKAYFKEKFGRNIDDPPTDPDPEVRKEWIKYWLDKYVKYYLKNKEMIDKFSNHPIYTCGNFKLQWPWSAWNYYLFNKGALDLLGFCEEGGYAEHNRFVFGYKASLAASHGKMGAILGPINAVGKVEAMACGGIAFTNPLDKGIPQYNLFKIKNPEIYLNFHQGGKVALLFHIKNYIFNPGFLNLVGISDQLIRIGVPFEVIIEDDLKKDLLKNYDVLLIPGVSLKKEEIDVLKDFVSNGKGIVLSGDNTDERGKNLITYFGKKKNGNSGFTCGKGKIFFFEKQVLKDKELFNALKYTDGLSFHLLNSSKDLFINVTTQPEYKLTEIHLVNYSGQIMKNLKIKVPSYLRGQNAVIVSPDGINQRISLKGEEITVPEVSIYDVIVIGGRSITEKILRKNRELFKERVSPVKGLETPAYVKNEIKSEEIPDGYGLSRYRAGTLVSTRRVFLSDFVYPKQTKVGKSCDIKMKNLLVGIWGKVYVEFPELIFQSLTDDYKEKVPIDFGSIEGEKISNKEITIRWKPEKKGKYQVYIHYYYTSPVYEGEPEFEKDKRYHLNLYFKGEPLKKIDYTDKIERMEIEVK